jgi:DNA-binding GntR family transcriptional regulator
MSDKCRAHGVAEETADRSTSKRGGSLVDELYVSLRDSIITWEICPDEILVESRVGQQFGVSKSPAREALALLCQDNLVEAIPRVGYRVTPISIQDIHEVYDLRQILEGEAALLAAPRVSKAEVEALLESDVSRGERLRNTDAPPAEYLRFHDAFHLGIAELSGNRRLHYFIHRLLLDSARLRMADPQMTIEGLAEEQEDSQGICAALAQRDGEAAAQILQEHIRRSKARILKYVVTATPSRLRGVRIGAGGHG